MKIEYFVKCSYNGNIFKELDKIVDFIFKPIYLVRMGFMETTVNPQKE